MLLHAYRSRPLVRPLLAVFAVVVAFALALHHSGLEFGGEHAHHGEHGAAASMCVGMAVAGIAVEGLVLLRRSRRNGRRAPRRTTARRRLIPAVLPTTGFAIARAGPPVHLHLCVDRR